MMPIILLHDLVTLETKATFNPHFGFFFREASDFSKYKETSTTFKQHYDGFLKEVPKEVIWTNNHL